MSPEASLSELVALLTARMSQPDSPLLSYTLDSPKWVEYVDLPALRELESEPDFPGDVVPLADGSRLIFSVFKEKWSLLDASGREYAL